MDADNKGLIGFIAVMVAAIVVIFGGMFVGLYFADAEEHQQEKENMQICLDAGKQWVNNSCINS